MGAIHILSALDGKPIYEVLNGAIRRDRDDQDKMPDEVRHGALSYDVEGECGSAMDTTNINMDRLMIVLDDPVLDPGGEAHPADSLISGTQSPQESPGRRNKVGPCSYHVAGEKDPLADWWVIAAVDQEDVHRSLYALIGADHREFGG